KNDIEPLVRFIEDTPRKDLIPGAAARIKAGTSYQDLLAAVFLAGVRGIQPRPVGFKFHAVMVVSSAHQASLAAEDRDRWLPPLDRCTKADTAATAELLAALRKSSASEASGKVAELLRKNVDPDALWDGLFLGAGEWLACQPGIVGLHCVTSMNALHHGYQVA